MNATLRRLLIDLKAAARLGSSEALQAALEPFRQMPLVGSNQPLPESFIAQWIAPLGQALHNPSVASEFWQALQADPLVGKRALAAYAQCLRYLDGANVDWQPLLTERRPEVHTAAVAALIAPSTAQQPRLLKLIERWGAAERPLPERRLAARLLPALGVTALAELLPFAASADPDLRKASVRCLEAIRTTHPVATMDWLETYLQHPQASDWVIGQALLGGWAPPAAACRLLVAAQQRFGNTRPLRQAAQAYPLST